MCYLNVHIMNKKVLILVIAFGVVAAGALVFVKTGGGGEGGSNDVVDNLLVPTAAADVYEDTNRLEVKAGSVTIKRLSGDEEEVTDETDVEVGDTIVVSADGKATLYWFDHSISRLAAGTELTIDQAAYNPENINEADIGFEVISGEVWSKVQAIVDEDSEFLGYAGNVVAGVRGSVFNFAVKGDEVIVDSIAHAMTVGDETMTSGEQGSFKKNTGDKVSVGAIPDDAWEREWFKNNLKNDEADHGRMMKAMMAKLKDTVGALPGEAGFDDNIARLDEFMTSDASPAEKEAVMAKFVALVRAIDVLPSDKLYAVKEMFQEKLLIWQDNDQRRAFLMKLQVERRLYTLYDWVKTNDPDPDQIKAYLIKFRNIIGEKNEFFHKNPELIGLVEKIIAALQDKMPGMMEDAEFLRTIDKINDLDEPEEPVAAPVSRTSPVREVVPAVKIEPVMKIEPQDPPESTEPKEVIEEEAPFHRGESNV